MRCEEKDPVHAMMAELCGRASFQIKQGCPFLLPVLLCIMVMVVGAAEHRFK